MVLPRSIYHPGKSQRHLWERKRLGDSKDCDAVFVRYTSLVVLGEDVRAIPTCVSNTTTPIGVLRIPYLFLFSLSLIRTKKHSLKPCQYLSAPGDIFPPKIIKSVDTIKAAKSHRTKHIKSGDHARWVINNMNKLYTLIRRCKKVLC